MLPIIKLDYSNRTVYCISFQKMLCAYMHICMFPIFFSTMKSYAPYRPQLFHSTIIGHLPV